MLRKLLLIACSCIGWSGVTQAAENAPSLEFLEYLGSMVERGDELIGPGDLEVEDEPEPFPDSIVVDPRAADNEEVIYD